MCYSRFVVSWFWVRSRALNASIPPPPRQRPPAREQFFSVAQGLASPFAARKWSICGRAAAIPGERLVPIARLQRVEPNDTLLAAPDQPHLQPERGRIPALPAAAQTARLYEPGPIILALKPSAKVRLGCIGKPQEPAIQ